MDIVVCLSFQSSVFVSFGYIPRSLRSGPYGSFIFSFLEKFPYCFPQWLHQSSFPPKIYESSSFSTPSPTFVICILFDDSHSDKCQVISYCGFDFHFLDYYWCWASCLLTIIISFWENIYSILGRYKHKENRHNKFISYKRDLKIKNNEWCLRDTT